MSARLAMLALGMAVMVGVAACGEKDQSLPATVKRSDAPAYTGAKDDFVAKGWTPGDKTSWDTQIHTRNQNQNEYNRTQ